MSSPALAYWEVVGCVAPQSLIVYPITLIKEIMVNDSDAMPTLKSIFKEKAVVTQ